MNKAIFLDRDGTINYDYGYVFDASRLEILKNCSEAIAQLRGLDFKIVIITNQSCIGRGMATEDQVNDTNNRLKKLLLQKNENAIVDAIEICPDHPDRPTPRRKPNAGMLLESKVKLNIDLERSWIIGDKLSDANTGIAAGIPKQQCILVQPNQIEKINKKNDFLMFNNLLQVSNHIKNNC